MNENGIVERGIVLLDFYQIILLQKCSVKSPVYWKFISVVIKLAIEIWNFGQETSNAIVLVGTKQQK